MPRNDHFRKLHLMHQPVLVRTYLSSKLPASTPYLGEILRRHAPDDERIQTLARRLLVCGSWAWRAVKDEHIWFRYQCLRPVCPRCSVVLRVREAARVWERFKKGSRLRRADFSAITIDADRFELGSDMGEARDKLFARCRKIAERILPGSRWAVYVEIAHGWNWTGRLHVHGIVHHPGWPREQVQRVLSEKFPAHQAAHVQPLYKEQSIKQGIVTFCGYAVHNSLKIEREWGIRNDDVPPYLTDLVRSYLSLIKRGLMGLRLEIGLRKKKLKALSTEMEMNFEESVGNSQPGIKEGVELGKTSVQYNRTQCPRDAVQR